MSIRRTGPIVATVSLCLFGLPGGMAHADAVGTCGTGGAAQQIGDTQSCIYALTGADTFNVPGAVTSLSVELIGGKGGDGYYQFAHPTLLSGGYGAFGDDLATTLTVTAGDSLSVVVAGNGKHGLVGSGGGVAIGGGPGGIGGGGDGGGSEGSGSGGGGGGGGGASSLHDSSGALAVAGGGGGGSGTIKDAGSGAEPGAAGHDGYHYECKGGGAGAGAPGHGGDGGGTPVSGIDLGPCVGGPGSDAVGGSGGHGGNSTGAASGVGGGGGGGGYFGGGGGQGSNSGDAAGGGGGSSYSTGSGTSAVTDTTGLPSVKIRFTLPAPTLALSVKDSTTGKKWAGTETPLARAYGSVVVHVNDGDPTPTGNVTYRLFSGNACAGADPFSSLRSIAVDGTVPDSSNSLGLAAGQYSMRADYDGDANFRTASSGCEAFSVLKRPQTTSFTSIPPGLAVVGGSYNPSAAATSTLTIHFSVDPSSQGGVCSYSSGTLSFTNPGTCILDARQAGDAEWAAAPLIQQDIRVWPASGGTMSSAVRFVSGGSPHQTITFSYTAPPSGVMHGTVTLAVPRGWSAPSTTSSAAGYSTSNRGTLRVSGRTIVVNGVTLASGGTLAITYGSSAENGPGAAATSAPGTQAWLSTQRSTTIGTPAALATSPSITVVARDGSGSMTADKSSVRGTHLTITFTYTVAVGGVHGGDVALTVPAGWSVPSRTTSAAGYVSISGGGVVSISGRTITVSGLTQAAGTTLTISYGSRAGGGPGATAPSITGGTQTWVSKEKSTAAGLLTPLVLSPSIHVG